MHDEGKLKFNYNLCRVIQVSA